MGRAVSIAELAEWLKAHDDYAVMGHVNPDGDAAGSCIAMTLALRSLGKRACAVLPEGLPERFVKFEGSDIARSDAEEPPFPIRTVLTLDTADQARMGEKGSKLADTLPTALLDHHGTNSGYGDVWYIDGQAAAAGEIAVDLIDALGVTITKDIARWLYIAISTDCGRFGYSNTRPLTMRAAARLIEAGIDVAYLNRELYNTRPYAKLLLTGEVYSRVKLTCGGKVAWSVLTKDMLEHTGALPEDSDTLSSEILTIEGVEVSVLAQERDDEVKFSLRSKEWADVANDAAKVFGGGGHTRAAGCSIKKPMDEAIAMMLTQVAKIFDEKTGV